MFMEKQVRATDPRLQTVYRHFKANLADVCRIGRASGAAVILCTVGSNLKDSAPFASLHRNDLTTREKKQWQQIYDEGISHEQAGRYAEAVARYRAAAAIDDEYADLQFRLGRCFWARQVYDEAKQRFVAARELDALRFRADDRINQTITEVVSAAGPGARVYLADAARSIEIHSPQGTPGQELFYEHVHLNMKGNYLLASAVFKQVETILPDRIRQFGIDQSLLDEADCAQSLAYTDWDRYLMIRAVMDQFLTKPPFTNQLDHIEQMKRFEMQLAELESVLSAAGLEQAADQYRDAIGRDDGDWWLREKYARLLMTMGESAPAAQELQWVADNLPHYYQAHTTLGWLQGQLGDLDGAIASSRKAIAIMPTAIDARYHLALACQLKGQTAEAIEGYRSLLSIDREYPPAWLNLGTLLYQQGHADQAIRAYRQAIRLIPNEVDLRYNLGVVLAKEGQRDEAVKTFRAALQIDPTSVKVRKKLNAVLGRAGS